jgi:hypothetical protein
VQQALEPSAPKPLLRALMDAIWHRALGGSHQRQQAWADAAALQALYLRGHWLRMPPVLLARHLTIKALGLHETPARATTNPTP